MDIVSLKSESSDNVSSEFVVVPSSETSGLEIGLKISANGEKLLKHLQDVMDQNDVVTDNSTDYEDSEVAKIIANDSSEDEDCILFNGVFYLGCSSVNAPRSELEALRTISILRSQQHPISGSPTQSHKSEVEQSHQQIEVALSVSSKADGTVRLLDPDSSEVITSFKLYTILFCVRGADDSVDRDCFAFTESHQSSGIFQCHVFRCDVPEAVRKVLYSFELAFQSIPTSSPENPAQPAGLQLLKRSQIHDAETYATSIVSPSEMLNPKLQLDVDESVYGFMLSLEIKEDDGKGGYATVPWDKNSSCFKFRRNLEKKVIVTVTQTSNVELTMERCFGLLLTPGRNVKQSDMHLLDMDRSSTDADVTSNGGHSVTGTWDPSHHHFALLNTETQKGTRVFLSVAVDFVVQEILEPVRFLVETKARVFSQNEKFWYFGKKILHENFYLKLREIKSNKISKKMYELENIQSESSRSRWSSHQVSQTEHALSSSSPQDEEDDDDTDEPLLSGSGEVSKECSEQVLSDWGDVLCRWRENLAKRPAGIRSLIRSGTGIPDPLRGEVWQLLADCHDNGDMLENYRILITKDSPQENIIQRDIHRTFPAHDYFKDAGGLGQDSLYRISKAYSVYDQEVGYCQGLSFLAAALLLHMPEEQAFCVLIKIMFQYKMRNLFKNGFEDLHLKFYQLERLIEDLMPNLQDHFKQLGIESHMFSSQWFLTLFTAKFPLNMVFQVVDVFLSEGEFVVFRVALALLECCRRELLALDFEGVLKYFRVQLPKKYRNEEQTRQLIQCAVGIKVGNKKLLKLEKDYQAVKEKLALEEDPLIRIEKENKHLMDQNMRLEMENDDLAQEIVTARITLETQLEKTMRHADTLQRDLQVAVEELRNSRQKALELSDENNRLLVETQQVKEKCRREMERQDEEIVAKTNIIADYKTICSQLSQRIESLQTLHKEEIESMRKSQPKSPNGHQQIVAKGSDHTSTEETEKFQKQIRDLELQLAQTKLNLVQSECKVQDLEHQHAAVVKELQANKNTWLQKTLTSFTARKTDPASSNVLPNTSFNASQAPIINTNVTSYSK